MGLGEGRGSVGLRASAWAGLRARNLGNLVRLSRNPSPPSILINTVGYPFQNLISLLRVVLVFGFFPFFGWFRNHFLKETKHGIQWIAMVKTRFEGVDQSTYDIVGLFSLLGPVLGSSSVSSATLNREVFYP